MTKSVIVFYSLRKGYLVKIDHCVLLYYHILSYKVEINTKKKNESRVYMIIKKYWIGLINDI